MVNVSEIANNVNNYFDDCEYISIADLIGKPVKVVDYETFENREGQDSIALKLEHDGRVVRTVTHAKALIDLIATDGVRDILDRGDTLDGTIVQKKSKQTGRNYITIQ